MFGLYLRKIKRPGSLNVNTWSFESVNYINLGDVFVLETFLVIKTKK